MGVGQSEAGIVELVDTLVFVAQPAAGDLIQFMKAGILEWPDIFFVNKSDLGEAPRRTAAELMAGLELGLRRDPDYKSPVLCGSARDNVGILGVDGLIEAIDAHQAYLKSTGQAERRKREGRVARVRTLMTAKFGRFGIDQLTGPNAVEAYVLANPTSSVDRIADQLGRIVMAAIRSEPN